MKRKLITFFIIIICFLLECTVFHRLAFATIKPNLLIIVTSSFGFMRGKKGPCRWISVGFLTDVFWETLSVLHPAFFGNWLHERVISKTLL